MAFDESGQADTVNRKFEICSRAYEILTKKIKFPPQDIIFDPNIFAVATGIKEHNNYALDFLEALFTSLTNFSYSSNVSFNSLVGV